MAVGIAFRQGFHIQLFAPNPSGRAALYTAAVPFPKLTDKEKLERLLASGKLTRTEAADVQRLHDGVAAGGELDSAQRLKANTLYDNHELDREGAPTSRRRSQARKDELIANFDAMPRPKKPPGR